MTVMELFSRLENKKKSSTLYPINFELIDLPVERDVVVTKVNDFGNQNGSNSSQTEVYLKNQIDFSTKSQDNPQRAKLGNGKINNKHGLLDLCENKDTAKSAVDHFDNKDVPNASQSEILGNQKANLRLLKQDNLQSSEQGNGDVNNFKYGLLDLCENKDKPKISEINDMNNKDVSNFSHSEVSRNEKDDLLLHMQENLQSAKQDKEEIQIKHGLLSLCETKESVGMTNRNQFDNKDDPNSSQSDKSQHKKVDLSLQMQDNLLSIEQGNEEIPNIKHDLLNLCESKEVVLMTNRNQVDNKDGPNSSQSEKADISLQMSDDLQSAEQDKEEIHYVKHGLQKLCENKEMVKMTNRNKVDIKDGPTFSQSEISQNKKADLSLQMQDELRLAEMGKEERHNFKYGLLNLCEIKEIAGMTNRNQDNNEDVPSSKKSLNKKVDLSLQTQEDLKPAEQHKQLLNLCENNPSEFSAIILKSNNCLENENTNLSTRKTIGIDSVCHNKQPQPKPLTLKGKRKNNKIEMAAKHLEIKTEVMSHVSKSSPPKVKRRSFAPEEKLDFEELRKPLDQGYVREVVYRMISTSTNCDIYYRPPQGPKLRSKNDVVKFLKKTASPFNMQQFSFSRIPLGFGEPVEVVRNANFSSGRLSTSLSDDQKKLKLSSPKKSTCIANKADTSTTANASKGISKIMNKIKLALNKDDNNYHIVKNNENNRSTCISGNVPNKKRSLSSSESLNDTVVIVQEELDECVLNLHQGKYRPHQDNRILPSSLSSMINNKILLSRKSNQLPCSVLGVKKLKSFKKTKLALKDCNDLSDATVGKRYSQKKCTASGSNRTSLFKRKFTNFHNAKKIDNKPTGLTESCNSSGSTSMPSIKHPLVPAMLHFFEVVDEVKSKNPTLKNFEISRIIDCMWRNLSLEDQKRFEDEHRQQMIVYKASIENGMSKKFVRKSDSTKRSAEDNLCQANTNCKFGREKKRKIENNSLRNSTIPVFQMSVNDYSEISLDLNEKNEAERDLPHSEKIFSAECPVTIGTPELSETARITMKRKDKKKKDLEPPFIDNTSAVSKTTEVECLIPKSVKSFFEASRICSNLENISGKSQELPCIENTTALSKPNETEDPKTYPSLSESSQICTNLENISAKAQELPCIGNNTAALSKPNETKDPKSVASLSEASRICSNLEKISGKVQELPCIENNTTSQCKPNETKDPLTISEPKHFGTARVSLKLEGKKQMALEKTVSENNTSDKARGSVIEDVSEFPVKARIRVRPMEELFAKPLEEKFPAEIVDQTSCITNLNVSSQPQCSITTSIAGFIKSTPIIVFSPNSNIQNAIPFSSTTVIPSPEASNVSSTCQASVHPFTDMTLSGSKQIQKRLIPNFSSNHSKSEAIGMTPTSTFILVNNSITNKNPQSLTYVNTSTTIQNPPMPPFNSDSNLPVNFLRNIRLQPSVSVFPTTNPNNIVQCSSQASINNENFYPNISFSHCTSNQQPFSNYSVNNQTLNLNSVPNSSSITGIMQTNSNHHSWSNHTAMGKTVASSAVIGLPLLFSTSPSLPVKSAIVSLPSQTINPLPAVNSSNGTTVVGLMKENLNSPNLGTQMTVDHSNIHHKLMLPYSQIRPQQTAALPNMPVFPQQALLPNLSVTKQQRNLQKVATHCQKTLSSKLPPQQRSKPLVSQLLPLRSRRLKTIPKHSTFVPKPVKENSLNKDNSLLKVPTVSLQTDPKCSTSPSKSTFNPELDKDTALNISLSTSENSKMPKPVVPNCQFSYFSTKNSEDPKKKLTFQENNNLLTNSNLVQGFSARPPTSKESKDTGHKNLLKKSLFPKTPVIINGSSAKTTPELSSISSSPSNPITESKKHISKNKILKTVQKGQTSIFSLLNTELQPTSQSFETLGNKLVWPLSNVEPFSDEFSNKSPIPSIFSDPCQQFPDGSGNQQLTNRDSPLPINIDGEEDRSLSPPLGIISEVFSLKDKENYLPEDEITNFNSSNVSQELLKGNSVDTSNDCSKSPSASFNSLNLNLLPSSNSFEATESFDFILGMVSLFNVNISNLKGYENIFSPSNAFAVIKTTDPKTGQLLAIRIAKKDGGHVYVKATGTVLFSGPGVKGKMWDVKILNFQIMKFLPTTSSESSDEVYHTSTNYNTWVPEKPPASTASSSYPLFAKISIPESINAIETPFS